LCESAPAGYVIGMSDMTGANPAGAGAAAGGTPSESDLPALQGLDESVDDPSDPTASRRQAADGGDHEAEITGVAGAAGSDDDGPSDPMPDMAGTS